MIKRQMTARSNSTPNFNHIFLSTLSFIHSWRSVNSFPHCAWDSYIVLTHIDTSPFIGLQYSKETKRPKWRCALQSTLNCLLPDPTRPREVGKTAVEGLTWDLTQNDSIALKGSCLVKLRLDKLNTVLLRPKDRCRNLQILLDAD